MTHVFGLAARQRQRDERSAEVMRSELLPRLGRLEDLLTLDLCQREMLAQTIG
jgi:hypothetical protein